MKVAVLIDDLFFLSKVRAAAQAANGEVIVCRSANEIPADVGRICIDLNAFSFDSVVEIARIKASGYAAPIQAFVSHVEVELKAKAEKAGADEVVPRSVFSQRLADLFKD